MTPTDTTPVPPAEPAPRILVVDDTPANVRVLVGMLKPRGFEVLTAGGGREGLDKAFAERPDLVLLDVMMPDMDGYEVCRTLRDRAETRMLPVVMVTALDQTEERVKGIEAGADDFLTKPVSQPELLARVRSLLRIKAYRDMVERQARELAEWNRMLEARVAEGVAQLERVGRLKRFLTPQVVDVVLSAGGEDLLKHHRREIVVVFLDLRGFTAFTETADPEEVMSVLNEYYSRMGRHIAAHGGTLDKYAGDGIMVFFNDPITVPDPAARAARMALDMQADFVDIAAGWKRRGYDLLLGIGIAQGYATLGSIGFEGRWDYGAIGTVCNLSARLCGEAKGGEILVSQRVVASLGADFTCEGAGDLALKGFHRVVPAFRLAGQAAQAAR
jgi:class 3 adenylate cyclase/CheY-like chemotaxis protein